MRRLPKISSNVLISFGSRIYDPTSRLIALSDGKMFLCLRRPATIVALATLVGCIGVGASAQSPLTIGTAAFDHNPAAVLNQPVRVVKMGCFSASETGYRCTTYHGAYVVLDAMAPAAIKAQIDAECGGIVASEEDPGCLFDVVFKPLAVSKGTGEIIEGDRSVHTLVWLVWAATGTVTRHR